MHRFFLLKESRAGKGLLAVLILSVAAFVGRPLIRAAAGSEGKATETGQYVGILKTGIMAIGGETTGVTLATADSGVYELDLGANAELKKQAEALNGRKALVVGDYAPRAGVEAKERRIIVVKSLRAVD